MFSKENSLKHLFILLLLIVLVSGCGAQLPRETRILTPRESAAAQLTRQGTGHLDAGEPDQAIRLFEQAMGLDPNNGECYYYIAQAWLAKGMLPQARQFNSLARDYLKGDADWINRLDRQADRIDGPSK